MRLLALSSLVLLLGSVYGDPSAGGGLYPPGLLPLINRANALLSTGQFNEAARVYSEAIDQSPTDYLLYYKRATAYFSLQRNTPALDDFDKVLSLTSGTFDNAHLMKARIYVKEGVFPLARSSLSQYVKAKKGKDKDADELEAEISEGERAREKTEKERRAQLWNACVESASRALRTASHSVEIRNWRAECAFAAGDLESAVGDLTRLSHLLPPSTTILTHIFRLSYFLLPPSPAPINALKQCLHFDPDSRPCLALHRMLKGFEKAFAKVEDMVEKKEWRGIVRLLLEEGKGKGKKKEGEVWIRFEEAMKKELGEEEVLPLVPPSLLEAALPAGSERPPKSHKKAPKISLPSPVHISPPRQTLLRALCKAYTHLSSSTSATSSQIREYRAQTNVWCSELLKMEGCAEDVDGLVGKGEVLLGDEEWEEAVRVLEKAFEMGGRGDREVLARLQKAQRLLKQSKQKDYYKILDVARDADPRTIKKAFRRQAKLAHPDKGGSEAKMALLNEAYEVLSNPELRARFDAGEDPMDPMAQQGGHPFQHGQHPFAQFFQQQGFPGGQQFFQGGFPGGREQRGGFHFSHGH